MKEGIHLYLLATLLNLFQLPLFGQANQLDYPKAKVDYAAFEQLVQQVKEHREKRLVSLDQFLELAKDDQTIILDTRSKERYLSKHLKGAQHLNFANFAQENLAKIIPDKNTTILIYCNNNFEGDEINFISKRVKPDLIGAEIEEITLALNIPTYINLYGYGYRNVYELNELIFPFDSRVEYAGTFVTK